MNTSRYYQYIFPGTIAFSVVLMLIGLSMGHPEQLLSGLWKIVTMQDLLITDYIHIAGPAAAFVNAGLVTIISILIIKLAKDPFNGFTIVEMGLMAGFSLFGKNVFNIWPIILGTWLYARYQKEPFSKYASVALLATALAPLVSYMALGSVHASLPLGVFTGILVGFLLPSLSAYTYKIQNGMNLYNMGFACGLAGSVLRGRPRDAEEVVSDAFLALWEHAGQVEPGKLRPWLGRVVRNKALNRLRALGGELPLEEDWLALEPDRRPGPAEAVEQAERAELIRALLNGLSPQDRATARPPPTSARPWPCRRPR